MTLLTTLSDAVRCWWRSDVIRVSPMEGHLLRVKCPCLIRVGDEEAIMTDKQVVRQDIVAEVVLSGHLVGSQLACDLSCSTGDTRVVWTRGNETIILSARDVTVFSMSGRSLV